MDLLHRADCGQVSTMVEIQSSHVAMVSRPAEVADLEKAATSVGAAAAR